MRSSLSIGIVACLATSGYANPAAAARVELKLAAPDGAAVADAVLSARPLDGRPLPPPAAATMDQRDRKFVPQILVVQVHATVRFANSDRVGHHVYSFSPARKFELYLKRGAPPQSVVFDRPGVVALGCNVHDWMLGYVDVVETPHFRQTDAGGRAALGDLPAGRYRLEVWHPLLDEEGDRLTREVTLGAADAESWSVVLSKRLLPSRDQVPDPGYVSH